MTRKLLALIVILLANLAAAAPAMAEVPLTGTVYEGKSVPGIALGFSRAQVEAAYGQPHHCQSSTPSDSAYCAYPESGGTLVSVRYEGADGSFAYNSADDQVTWIRWGETLSDWTTTTGVNTTMVKNDPDAAIAAYPNADVTYSDPNNPDSFVESIVDWLQGIEIRRSFDGYTHSIHVSMAIFEPLSSLPTAQETHVQKIKLSAYKDRGIRKVYGWAEILDEYGRAATGASVDATWMFPDGSTQATVEDFVGIDAVAFFELFAPQGQAYRGIYTLRIDDVNYLEHTFNPADSILSDTIYVR